jgi:transposase
MNEKRRHELTNDQWARLAPLLPKRARVGRPPKDHRLVLNALYWLLRTGAPWRDLPERYGPWQTVYSRFRRWRLAGVWDRVLAALQAEADAAGRLDWSLHFVDGSTVRAHQHAAGARKGGAIKRLAAAGAASAPSCTCASSAGASRS